MSLSGATWFGRPIDAMSREELLEVIDYLSKRVAEERSPDVVEAKILGRIQVLRDKYRFDALGKLP